MGINPFAYTNLQGQTAWLPTLPAGLGSLGNISATGSNMAPWSGFDLGTLASPVINNQSPAQLPSVNLSGVSTLPANTTPLGNNTLNALSAPVIGNQKSTSNTPSNLLGGVNLKNLNKSNWTTADLRAIGVSQSFLMLQTQVNTMISSVLAGLPELLASIMSNPQNFMSNGLSAMGGANASYYSGPAGERERAAINWALSKEGISESNNPSAVRSFSNGAWQPWCADFVSKAFESTGGSPWGHISSVAGIRSWGQKNGRYFKKGSKTPQPGDVIVFENGMSHVGIVVKVENGKVYTIEGNTSDAVHQRSYSLNDARISGYVRPFGPV
ncbi:MAG TPA: CHAP domain-containing protein [Oculatellaceae cyanobacterium]|jgi:hypothetical protein